MAAFSAATYKNVTPFGSATFKLGDVKSHDANQKKPRASLVESPTITYNRYNFP